MVNGQTGKIVGAVPSDKKKENMIFTVLSIICGLICGLISSVFMADASEDSFKLLIVGVFLAIFAFGYGKGVRNDYEKSQKLTTERAMKDLVAERQDGE